MLFPVEENPLDAYQLLRGMIETEHKEVVRVGKSLSEGLPLMHLCIGEMTAIADIRVFVNQ